MAVVMSPVPLIHQQMTPIRYPEIRVPEMMENRGEIIEESPLQSAEDKIYVAVGKEVNESLLTLSWALHNSGGRKICILHVHTPAQRIPLTPIGSKLPASQLDEQKVRAYRLTEKQDMNKLLHEYSMICNRAEARTDILHIEMDSVKKGIIELISQHGIKKLVMGAAADKHYSRKMKVLKSKKAIYVSLQAPVFCHISFICKGNLIDTREGRLEGASVDVAPLTSQPILNSEIERSPWWRLKSVTEGRNDWLKLVSPITNHRRGRSNLPGRILSAFSPCSSGGVTPRSSLTEEQSFDEWNGIFRSHLNSPFSPFSAFDMTNNSVLTSASRIEDGLQYCTLHCSKDDYRHASPSSVLGGDMVNELYDQLEQAMAEAEKSGREAFEESIRCRKAEKAAINVFRKARMSQSLYADELRQRKQIEEVLVGEKEELKR